MEIHATPQMTSAAPAALGSTNARKRSGKSTLIMTTTITGRYLQLGRKALCAQGIGKSARDWDVQTKGGG